MSPAARTFLLSLQRSPVRAQALHDNEREVLFSCSSLDWRFLNFFSFLSEQASSSRDRVYGRVVGNEVISRNTIFYLFKLTNAEAQGLEVQTAVQRVVQLNVPRVQSGDFKDDKPHTEGPLSQNRMRRKRIVRAEIGSTRVDMNPNWRIYAPYAPSCA